jgi:preprotein translocase subunit SecE
VAKETRSTRRQKREAGAPSQGVADRARERRRRVKPVAETKAQTGQKRERRGGGGFIRESYAELRKVEWPNQRQLVSATAAVIVAVAVVGFFLWVADEAFSHFVRDVLLKL